ncbi:hypothetical protein [Nocardiopsis kunsanensis]|uniref:Uncharacterized protein n=1 Tax=Nocardiopsis kunsanensis TaxID=141693 RepID=A0A918XAE3_9ACTN|nr:hypothetical protein [Nocardiopsis kunsanensis]GHD21494.1 hypothetical protein GCM10007147_14930 [Nocardiopsis kunsanensis]
MSETKKSLDDLVRAELGEEPSQEAKDYARQLYERYRIPRTDDTGDGSADSGAATDTEGSAPTEN